ncbi:hypothetical protein DO97_07225 [Neosynechococcus sphagnicola sy1]|uniref:Major facilitator superfamily (MFS) profile domain-containing protein n=1 Tax=Neosynechococcus sphagnicola sy1 TaxID=1497020 RepID=A0A098TJZ9_9CYAN|nr:MFS transporter [Neosynechococcus sphagnicola]KGF72629.1 hypothetical protein DO97_07225 [Neosynechococcus sphagnicola sy1]
MSKINRHFGWAASETFFVVSILIAVLFALLSESIAAELHLDTAQLGLLSGAFFITYAISQLLFGILLDYLPPRLLLAATATVAAVGAFLFSVSTGMTGALIGRILLGVGLSSTFVGMMYLVGRTYPDNFAFMSSLGQSLANVTGAVLAIVCGLFPLLGSFRLPFQIMGVLLGISAILLLTFVGKTSQATSAESPPKISLWAALAIAVGNLQFWAALVYYTGLFGTLLAFADLWNIQFQIDFFKHAAQQAGLMNAMIPLGVTVGSLLAGAWARKTGSFVFPARAFGFFSLFLFGVMLAISLSQGLATLMFFLLGFGLGGRF